MCSHVLWVGDNGEWSIVAVIWDAIWREEKTGSDNECLTCGWGVVGAMGVMGVLGTEWLPDASNLGKSLDFVFIRESERFFTPNREKSEKKPFCGLLLLLLLLW